MHQKLFKYYNQMTVVFRVCAEYVIRNVILKIVDTNHSILILLRTTTTGLFLNVLYILPVLLLHCKITV